MRPDHPPPWPWLPTVANVIYDAPGDRIHDLPITPERVLRALGKL